ncbi:uncharacterized protein LOC143154105 [Ptiloglossa arizonensis]|uniref:uncharacterized protein LOC143154105 n=1 Tax=Ptiloglossa arizonensis TaxID=3350558 RepID=UPI003FA065C5
MESSSREVGRVSHLRSGNFAVSRSFLPHSTSHSTSSRIRLNIVVTVASMKKISMAM